LVKKKFLNPLLSLRANGGGTGDWVSMSDNVVAGLRSVCDFETQFL